MIWRIKDKRKTKKDLVYLVWKDVKTDKKYKMVELFTISFC